MDYVSLIIGGIIGFLIGRYYEEIAEFVEKIRRKE